MDNSRLDRIRKAVHLWYKQRFSYVNGWGIDISQNDAGEDVFTGLHLHLRGIMTDTTYTVIDDDTDEDICFGIDDVVHMIYDHLVSTPKPDGNTKYTPYFKSEMLDDLHMEFIEDITDPDYDVYEKYFRPLPDGTYEFIGRDKNDEVERFL